MKTVNKLWGIEIWIANCEEYCGKFLNLRAGYISSYHYHRIKKETFYCLDGKVLLTVEGVTFILFADDEPVTIHPGQKHSFESISPLATLLEISTTHSDEDVVRVVDSHRGGSVE